MSCSPRPLRGRVLRVDFGASIGQVPLQVGERPDGLVEAVEDLSCAGAEGSHRLGAAAWLLDTECDADSANLERDTTPVHEHPSRNYAIAIASRVPTLNERGDLKE